MLRQWLPSSIDAHVSPTAKTRQLSALLRGARDHAGSDSLQLHAVYLFGSSADAQPLTLGLLSGGAALARRRPRTPYGSMNA